MVPKHLGIILDGNRRWAKSRGLSPTRGHLAGYEKFHDMVLYAILEKGVKCISAYIFSAENWQRSEKEVNFLMKLVIRALDEYLEEFNQKGIRVLVAGRRDKLSRSVLKAIEKAEVATKGNRAGTLVLCFNYGGHAEIVDAAKKLVESGVAAKDIDAAKFEEALYHPEVPPVDLVIRTSGEQRLSGFMLWRTSYAELLFVDKHWPEFDKSDIDAALEEFAQRQRRYGV